MHYSREQFDDSFAAGTLHIALIGMSGIGKSWRAKHLAQFGFEHIDCDALIAARIAEKLSSTDVSGLAAWMGRPHQPGFRAREREYLALEAEVLEGALARGGKNTVIDATGSVVYLPQELQKRLKAKTSVVLLDADARHRETLFEMFLADPRPVVWGDSFTCNSGEDIDSALLRSYHALLDFRAAQYRALADVVIPYHVARDRVIDGEGFCHAIRERL